MGLLSAMGLAVKARPDGGLAAGEAPARDVSMPPGRSALGPLLDRHENPTNQNHANEIVVRILLAAFGLSMALNVIQGMSLYVLFPMHTVMPYLVTFSDKSEQMVRIDPPTTKLTSVSIILKDEIEQYMKSRYTITGDAAETTERWQTHVRLFSTTRVYNEFQSEVAPVADLMKEGRFTRQVKLVNTLQPEPGLFHVDFDVYDHTQGNGLADSSDKEYSFSAELRVAMRPQFIQRAMIALNPFGFTVYQYSMSPRHQ